MSVFHVGKWPPAFAVVTIVGCGGLSCCYLGSYVEYQSKITSMCDLSVKRISGGIVDFGEKRVFLGGVSIYFEAP